MANGLLSWQGLLNLFLESRCPLCQRSTRQVFCIDCERQLADCRLPQPVQRVEADWICCGWGQYGGALKRAIAALKYDNHPELGRPLGQRLGQTWRQLSATRQLGQLQLKQLQLGQVIVVPIPLHAAKQQKRGYNQAELLAEGFCQVTGLRLLRQGLQRVRETEAMFGLSPAQRQQNLTEAFQLGRELATAHPKTRVLLLDDIYTTGTTIRAAVDVLHRANIPVVGVAALAIATSPSLRSTTTT